MTKKQFVQFLQAVLPTAIFTRIRRRTPLCHYNYHSAVRNRAQGRRQPDFDGIVNTCAHCGAYVERDRAGQWRAMPKLMPIFMADRARKPASNNPEGISGVFTQQDHSRNGFEPGPECDGPDVSRSGVVEACLQSAAEDGRIIASREY